MRAILISLAFALSALLLSAQTPYLGTGRAMLPTWTHASRLVVYESDLTDMRAGDLVARQLGVYLIGTRAIRRTVDGWITRADSASTDDPGMMVERTYAGKVYPDLSRADGRADNVNGPIVHNLYVLTPYRAAMTREVGEWRPPIVRPGTDDPSAHVPEGSVFTALALTLTVLCAARIRHFHD